jgi:hypothetical protein
MDLEPGVIDAVALSRHSACFSARETSLAKNNKSRPTLPTPSALCTALETSLAKNNKSRPTLPTPSALCTALA